MERLRLLPVLLLSACSGGSTSTPDAPPVSPDSAVDAPPPPTFHISGTVTGFAGSGLVLQLDGADDLPITADGTFMFASSRPAGASFAVTVKSSPMCPERACKVTNGGSGTIGNADVTDVTVSCEVPSYRLLSQSWLSNDARVTDDLGAFASGDTATPRVISGANTGVNGAPTDGAAIDSGRDLLYVGGTLSGTLGISVFASSASGDAIPTRRIVLTGETAIKGLELDPAADRLYVSVGSGKLLVFDQASTLDGAVTPTVTVPLTAAGPLSLDRAHDRLYVGVLQKAFSEFDDARQLTATSTPSRSVTWATGSSPSSIAIDACHDRVYLGFRDPLAGHNLYAFDGAAALTGAIDLETATARASVPTNQVMSTVLDSQGAIYFWPDSPTAVHIVDAPHLWTGALTVTPDRSINGVVNRGYSLDVQAYQ